MHRLNEDIKSGQLKKVYLLYGEEAYLRKQYKDRLKAALVGDDTMNYHYFEGKDALLSTVSYLFDEKYEELMGTMDPAMDRFDQLMYLNRELFAMIENSIALDLLARLFSSQLITRGDKHLLDHNRTYYKLLRHIVREGQERGDLRSDITVSEMVRVYALCERALIYDWCLSAGDYSLVQYGRTMMPMFFREFRG